MTDSRSWIRRANDYAGLEMMKLEGRELSWELFYECVRGAYVQGAFDQYNALENEWSEEHPNPGKDIRDAVRHRA